MKDHQRSKEEVAFEEVKNARTISTPSDEEITDLIGVEAAAIQVASTPRSRKKATWRRHRVLQPGDRAEAKLTGAWYNRDRQERER
jgi:hypothetical protein